MSNIIDKSIRDRIITATGNIVISANAGTGKTFMTVERIKHDLIETDNYQTYAAITFTNKAAKELKTRLNGIEEGFIGTNDKFIINEIIVPFAKDVIPQMKDKAIVADYTDIAKADDDTTLINQFINEGVIGTYNDLKKNFGFKLALHLLMKSHAASRYIKNRYFRIYIDEYQDSDRDMHKLFKYINTKLNVPLFIVGDKKQSIYEWRGGYPEGFQELIESENYSEFKLFHNFRSNIPIQNYATVFIDDIRENFQQNILDKEVQGCCYKDERMGISYINSWLEKKENCAFLLYSNNEAKQWAERLKELGFVYIPRTPIDNPKLESSQIWVSKNIASYYWTKRYNEYSFYDEIPNQDMFDITKIKENLKRIKSKLHENEWNDSVEKAIKELYILLVDSFDEDRFKSELKALKETLTDSQYEISFNLEVYNRVVTTIHSSKGLQYKQVILNASNYVYEGKISDEQLHYVAITRPENKLLIMFDEKNKKATAYYEILKKEVEKMVSDDVKVSDVIKIVKV